MKRETIMRILEAEFLAVGNKDLEGFCPLKLLEK
jgi:hypothetical protein